MKTSTDHLLVQQLDTRVDGWGWTTHIKVSRRDGQGGITWDELQAVKDEHAPNERAIEVFPRAADLVNEVNMRHLWIVPEGIALPNLARR